MLDLLKIEPDVGLFDGDSNDVKEKLVDSSWLGNKWLELTDGEAFGILVELTEETTVGIINGDSDSMRKGLEDGLDFVVEFD